MGLGYFKFLHETADRCAQVGREEEGTSSNKLELGGVVLVSHSQCEPHHNQQHLVSMKGYYAIQPFAGRWSQQCYLLPRHGCHYKQGSEKSSGTARQRSKRMQLSANRRVNKTASGFNEFKQSPSSHDSRPFIEKSRDNVNFECSLLILV